MFADEYFNHEKLRSLGWLSVPVIDVEKSDNWLTATSKLISAGYTDYVENDWVVKPIALKPQFVFTKLDLFGFCEKRYCRNRICSTLRS